MSELTCQDARAICLQGTDAAADELATLEKHLAGCTACVFFASDIEALEADLKATLEALAEPAQPGHVTQEFLERAAQVLEAAEEAKATAGEATTAKAADAPAKAKGIEAEAAAAKAAAIKAIAEAKAAQAEAAEAKAAQATAEALAAEAVAAQARATQANAAQAAAAKAAQVKAAEAQAAQAKAAQAKAAQAKAAQAKAAAAQATAAKAAAAQAAEVQSAEIEAAAKTPQAEVQLDLQAKEEQEIQLEEEPAPALTDSDSDEDDEDDEVESARPSSSRARKPVLAVSRDAASSPFTPARLAAASALVVVAGLVLASLGGGSSDAPAALRLKRGLDERDYVLGEKLQAGDVVRAEAIGSLGLPGAWLDPAPGCVLKIDRLDPRKLSLEEGSVACAVAPHSGQLLITCDLGVVSVVGTRFVVTRTANSLEVLVSEGQVHIRAAQGDAQVDLGPGQSAALNSAGKIDAQGAAEPPPAPSASCQSANDPSWTPVDEADVVAGQLENISHGAVCKIAGRISWLPDGASLDVTLDTLGFDGEPVPVASFQVPLQRGQFEGSSRWPRKKFAPLIYRALIELTPSKQTPAIQLALKEAGHPTGAKIEVSRQLLSFGTTEEQLRHDTESLAWLSEYTQRCQDVVAQASATAQLDPGGAAWETSLQALTTLSTYVQSELRLFEGTFLVRRESSLILTLKNALADGDQTIQRKQAGGAGVEEDLKALGARIAAVGKAVQTH